MSTDNTVIRTMTVDEFPSVKEFLINHYYPDDTLSYGLDPVIASQADPDDFLLEYIKSGNSLIAEESHSTHEKPQIVGVAIAGEIYAHKVQSNYESAQKAGNEIYHEPNKLLSKLEVAADIFSRYSTQTALYLHMTAVHRSFRGKRLGLRLASKLMEIGRERKYKIMVCYSCSYYSIRQKEMLGMKCVHTINYKDFKNEQGNIVFQPPPPHTCIKAMVLEL